MPHPDPELRKGEEWGACWIYLGTSTDNDKTTWRRTINDFSDDSHIHFEQAHSIDKIHGEVQCPDDEVRTDKSSK